VDTKRAKQNNYGRPCHDFYDGLSHASDRACSLSYGGNPADILYLKYEDLKYIEREFGPKWKKWNSKGAE
jgi:hypothetical protein